MPQQANTEEFVRNWAADISGTVILVLLCVVVVMLAVWLLTKYIKAPKYSEVFAKRMEAYNAAPEETRGEKPVRFSFIGILFAILGVALIVRLIFTFTTLGYRPELDSITNDILLNSRPTSNFTTATITHYPMITYIYSFFGLFARLFGLQAGDTILTLFVSLPLIFADIGLICIIYIAAKKHINEYTALVLAGFVAVFPPFIMVSSMWGAAFGIGVMLIVLTFYFMANKKMLGVFITYTIALLTTRAALYLFPVIAVFVIYQLIKAAKILRTKKIRGIKAVYKDGETRAVVLIPVYIISFWLLSWLLTMPIMFRYTFNPFVFTSMIYFRPLVTFGYYGQNALNIFNLFVGLVGNGAAWTATPTVTGVLSALFALIITALVIVIYVTRKNRALLVFVAAFAYLILSILFIGFNAYNLILVIALLLLAFILVKDRRILMAAGLLGLILTLNMAFVFISAGFLNNFYFDPIPNTILGAEAGAVGWLAANLILTVFTILVFVYLTVVILDVVMANRRRPFMQLEKPTFFRSFSAFVRLEKRAKKEEPPSKKTKKKK